MEENEIDAKALDALIEDLRSLAEPSIPAADANVVEPLAFGLFKAVDQLNIRLKKLEAKG